MKIEKKHNLNGDCTGAILYLDSSEIYQIKEDLEEKKLITLSSEELLLELRKIEGLSFK